MSVDTARREESKTGLRSIQLLSDPTRSNMGFFRFFRSLRLLPYPSKCCPRGINSSSVIFVLPGERSMTANRWILWTELKAFLQPQPFNAVRTTTAKLRKAYTTEVYGQARTGQLVSTLQCNYMDIGVALLTCMWRGDQVLKI
jgi:hypothetical protein